MKKNEEYSYIIEEFLSKWIFREKVTESWMFKIVMVQMKSSSFLVSSFFFVYFFDSNNIWLSKSAKFHRLLGEIFSIGEGIKFLKEIVLCWRKCYTFLCRFPKKNVNWSHCYWKYYSKDRRLIDTETKSWLSSSTFIHWIITVSS